MKNQKVVVELKHITKTFGQVVANEGVNLSLKEGEIHALLGENGAGKSTLMNMLSGIYTPDSGFIFVHSNKVSLSSPKKAIQKGIGMVHQHFKLVESFTAKENIVSGSKDFFANSKVEEEKIKVLCEKYGLAIDLNKKVCDMAISEKQMLEIIKVLYRGCDILILDEPTAVLTPQEVEVLFSIIRKMKQDNKTIVIITHKLHEVMAVCDRVTVLLKGKVAATVNIEETNPAHLTELMVGHSEALHIQRIKPTNTKVIYEANQLTMKNKEGVKVLDDVSVVLRQGEILGVAGVAGSGQKELCEALVGLLKVQQGRLVFEDEDVTGLSPRAFYHKGVAMSFIPEDRLGMGLVGSMDIVDNMLLKEYHTQKGFWLSKKEVKEKAERLVNHLQVKTPSVFHPIKRLSGGNIQKVLLGREIEAEPKVLITAYAVRGLDVGATHQIYDLINAQKAKGVAVMFVGEDLDVLMQFCDRIMVMCQGKVTGVVDAKAVTKEELGLMMGGEVRKDQKEAEHAS